VGPPSPFPHAAKAAIAAQNANREIAMVPTFPRCTEFARDWHRNELSSHILGT